MIVHYIVTVTCRPYQRSAQMQRTYEWQDDAYAGRELIVSVVF